MAYKWWGKRSLAILHFPKAVEIKNNAGDRINRGWTYDSIGQCDLAIADAKVGLSMEPLVTPNAHTHFAADYILSWCYFVQGNALLALQHIDAAISTGRVHEFRTSVLDVLTETREYIIQEAQR